MNKQEIMAAHIFILRKNVMFRFYLCLLCHKSCSLLTMVYGLTNQDIK